jgi:hypothetical protein
MPPVTTGYRDEMISKKKSRPERCRPRFQNHLGTVFALLVWAILSTAAVALSQELESGQVVIFLKNGSRVIGEFSDISAPRSVLELKSGREIRLSAIWMINFIDKKWYFPEELEKIVKPEHYLFLKNGEVISGKIVDYNDRIKVFELDDSGTTEIGKLNRIYFSKTIPPKLLRILKKAKNK